MSSLSLISFQQSVTIMHDFTVCEELLFLKQDLHGSTHFENHLRIENREK